MFGNDFFLTTLAPFSGNLHLRIFFLPTLAFILMFFYIVKKLQTISDLKKKNQLLNNSLERVDQEAKLILESDMDIRLCQLEVENVKISAIRKLLFATSSLLDKEALFSQIDSNLIENLGFRNCLLLNFSDLSKLKQIGFQPQEVDLIKNVLLPKKQLFKEKRLLSSQKSETCKIISSKLKIKNILIAPVKSGNTVHCLFIVGKLTEAGVVTVSMKEALMIVCLHLAKCLDNINLFEQAYRTRDELENKIKIRTNELVLSLQKVEAVSKTKSDFISSVSHELRTPLTSVKGFSSLLASEKFGKLPEKAKDRLDKVVKNVDKLMDIVNTLLDISRIESGKIDMNIVPHNIVLTIKNIADFFEPQSQEKKIPISVDTPPQLFVFMDKDLIERVLTNLLNNALKFTPAEGKIKISCQSKGEKAIISITDTGYGISEENLNKIFQEFYRVKEIEKKAIKGSGLGLSLVKKIIEGHGEKIWAESKVGKGTTFFFTLTKKKNG